MPELPEIHNYSFIINKNCKDKVFTEVKDPTRKFEIPFKKFTISSEPNGKELKLIFTSVGELDSRSVTFYFTHGLTGRWEFSESAAPMSKSVLLVFVSSPHTLYLIDQMRMSKWTREQNKKRSPDPVLQFDKFVQKVHSGWSKHGNKTIADFLHDQAFFNGIGNYLRCEIMYRAAVSPFKLVKEVFKDTPSYIDLDTVNENSDFGSRILYLCNQIPLEILKLGLNKYGNQEELDAFNSWLRIYGKGSSVKKGNQQIYYSNEQVSHKLKPDLPSPIKTYPLDNDAIKMTIKSTTKASTISQKPSSPASFSKMENVSIDLVNLLDKELPPLTIMLIIIRELQKKGRIHFMQSSMLKKKAIEYDRVLYSILEVFYMTKDESELIDSLNRM